MDVLATVRVVPPEARRIVGHTAPPAESGQTPATEVIQERLAATLP